MTSSRSHRVARVGEYRCLRYLEHPIDGGYYVAIYAAGEVSREAADRIAAIAQSRFASYPSLMDVPDQMFGDGGVFIEPVLTDIKNSVGFELWVDFRRNAWILDIIYPDEGSGFDFESDVADIEIDAYDELVDWIHETGFNVYDMYGYLSYKSLRSEFESIVNGLAAERGVFVSDDDMDDMFIDIQNMMRYDKVARRERKDMAKRVSRRAAAKKTAATVWYNRETGEIFDTREDAMQDAAEQYDFGDETNFITYLGFPNDELPYIEVEEDAMRDLIDKFGKGGSRKKNAWSNLKDEFEIDGGLHLIVDMAWDGDWAYWVMGPDRDPNDKKWPFPVEPMYIEEKDSSYGYKSREEAINAFIDHSGYSSPMIPIIAKKAASKSLLKASRRVAMRIARVKPYRSAYRKKTALKIIMEQGLGNFEFWSGAKQRADELSLDDLEQIEFVLEDIYPDGLTETEVNDLFWFDEDFIATCLGYEDWEDMENQRRNASRKTAQVHVEYEFPNGYSGESDLLPDGSWKWTMYDADGNFYDLCDGFTSEDDATDGIMEYYESEFGKIIASRRKKADISDWSESFGGWERDYPNGDLGWVEDCADASSGDYDGYDAWIFEGGVFGEGDVDCGHYDTVEEACAACDDSYGKNAKRRARFVRSSCLRFAARHRRDSARCKNAAYGYFSDEAVDSIYQEFSEYFYDALGRDFVDLLDQAENEGGIQYWQDRAFEYEDSALGSVLDEGNNAISRVISDEAQNAADMFKDEIKVEIASWLQEMTVDEVSDSLLGDYGSGDEVPRADIEDEVETKFDEYGVLEMLGVDVYRKTYDSIVQQIVDMLGDNEVIVAGRRTARRLRRSMRKCAGYTDDVKGFIIDKLHDYEGESFYGCDLASELTMNENMDGGWIFSYPEAMQYIADNMNFASDTFDYYKDNLDMAINPFENPAAFTFYMLDFGVGSVLAQCPYVDEHWNDDIELDAETIATICKQVESVSRIAKVSRKMRAAMRRNAKRFAVRTARKARRR